MPLEEYHAQVQLAGWLKLVLVVDASESAQPVQPQIAALVAQLMPMLPVESQITLYFLGNPAPYPANRFAARAPSWFEENRSRASLISPIWEQLYDPAMHQAPTTVVIGAGSVYDIEDWQGTPLLDRAILAPLGESLQAQRQLARQFASPTADQLVREIYDPVVRVQIRGPAFMPVRCTNPGYRVRIGGGEVVLTAEMLGDYSAGLDFFAAIPGELQIATSHRSGKETVSALTAASAGPGGQGPSCGTLTPDETVLLRRAVRHESIRCPICGRTKPWDTLYCEQGAVILGERIYPSLRCGESSGFVVFATGDAHASFQWHAFDVLRLGARQVAVRDGSVATIYEFDDERLHWAAVDRPWVPYQPLGDQRYAILL